MGFVARAPFALHFSTAVLAASLLLSVATSVARADASVTFQAESGALGADWALSNSASPAFITITTTNTANPGSASRVATYNVTFPAAGTYQLYARVQVGPNTFNNDSLFYGNGFGTKNPTTGSDWMLANGLGSAGFTNGTDVVTNGGTLGSGMWKWINLSQFTGQPGFVVNAGNLTQTFQIGGRETNLGMDKFVFGLADYTFTVSNLDNGTDGTPPLSPALVPLRRPISPQQPMWLVHIDTWNFADPQKIIDLIPPDIRPYVVMNISLSISHTTNSQFQVAEYGYEIARSWLRVCAQNRMWAMIQPSSGGYSQFSDFDLSVYEEFYREYPNLIGFNYAEQFWGYGDADPLATAWPDRINHFANLLPLCRKYGGYLVVSWCGNQWSPNINPMGMLKRNPAFAAACRDNTENYILEEKYTQQSYQSDMESLCLGAYLSGYSGQYGIRYDSTGWTDATGTNQNFMLASGGAPHLEHIMLTGQTVIDAPELIWQQCFQELSTAATSNGYTMRRWNTFPQFDNVSIDLFRKILDGTVRIPTRQEVIDRTKVVIVNDVNSGSDDDKYSSPETLFEGLYRMDGDFNLRSNKTFFKKTGRYPTVPTVYQLADSNANSFAVQVNKSAYSTRWPSIAAKTNEFNSLFPQEYTGDIYAGRHQNGWVIYNPYKTGQAASGSIPFKYNTCSNVDLTLSQYTAGVMKEYSNSVTIYLANYLTSGMRTNTITIQGSTTEPTWSFTDRASHSASTVSKSWSGGVFTLTVQHNGPLDITVNCAGTATGRLTNFTSAVVTPPAQPLTYWGSLQYEAEVFDYKSIAGIVKSGWDQPVRNYSGQGYAQFGASASAALRKTVTVLKAGTYRLDTKYSNTNAPRNNIYLYVNGVYAATPAFATTPTYSDWAVNTQSITLNAGANIIEFLAQGTGASVYFDNLVVAPAVDMVDGIVIQENATGFASVDGTIDSNFLGYTGAGYANTTDTNGASLYWNLYFGSSVTKSLTFRYANTNARTANLIVNGVNVTSGIQFPSTGAWTNWGYVTVYPSIASGASQVRLQATSADGLPNLDYVEVVGGGTTTTLPPSPTGLAATAVAADQINLTWIASSNASSYNLGRATVSGGPYPTIATDVVGTNYSDTGLVPATTYYYAVSAVNYIGESVPSAQAAAATFQIQQLQAQADSYVESGGNAGVNYGSSTNLLVKNNTSTANRRAYLLFDVHGLANAASATLTLMANRVDDATVPMYYESASTNWTENGITWNNQPGGTGVFLTTNTVAVGVPVVLDVTSAARSAATNGGWLSLRITQPSNTQNGLIQFCSKEHPTNSWRPVLTYQLPVNTPPTLAAISSRTVDVGVTLNLTNAATDSDVPAQALTFRLLSAPTNAVLNTNSGVLTWRPLVSQQNTTNPFAVIVADNGTPSLSATNNFIITVNPATQPALSSIAVGSQVSLSATGMIGPDYALLVSSNLVSWQTLFTTNPVAMPVMFTDPNRSAAARFYRLQLGP
jgi:hypothetical protein